MAKPFQFRLRTLLLAIVPAAAGSLLLRSYLRQPISPQPVVARGIVKLNGVPLDDVWVVFVPIDPDGEIASAITDAKGRFDLRNTANKIGRGAFPGSYIVSVSDKPENRPGRMPWPYHFDDASQSGLTAKVTQNGPNIFVFNLLTKDSAHRRADVTGATSKARQMKCPYCGDADRQRRVRQIAGRSETIFHCGECERIYSLRGVEDNGRSE